jgi:hypothetical protein
MRTYLVALSVFFLMAPALAAAQTSAGGVDVPLGGMDEPTIAVNPLDPNNIAVASNGHIPEPEVAFFSTDGGATFSAPTYSALPLGYLGAGDPSVAFDSQGRLFWTYLGLRKRNPGRYKPDVFISQVDPATGAVLPGYPVNVSAAAGVPARKGNFNDKEWLAVDRFAESPFRDRIYVVWTYSVGDIYRTYKIVTTYSSDQGMTWSPALTLFTTEGFWAFSHNAVAPNGDVYIAYNNPGAPPWAPVGESGYVSVLRSTDGGVSYPQETTAYAPGDADVTWNLQHWTRTLFKSVSLTVGSRQAWVLPDPWNTNNVYVLSSDDPTNLDHGEGFDDMAVYIVRSLNRGLTWSAPTQIDSGPGTSHQFFPTAMMDDLTGCMAVTWYDSRAGLTNEAGNFLLDLYLTSSSDGGLTFDPEVQLNDVAFDPDLGTRRYGSNEPPTLRIGEYNGVAVDDRMAHAVWTGNSDTGPQILFDRAAICDNLVFVDIKPGGDPNAINPMIEGVIPVALLGWEGFDVNDVDVTTLAFGPGDAAFDHSHGPHFEDVDGDGLLDLVSHYRTEDTGIAFGDMEACLRGQTLDGKPFQGCDAVRTVPDMDGDWLLDLDEASLGTNALNPDTDGDGFGDGEEVLTLGTDPLDAQDPAPVRRRAGKRRR